MLVAAARQVTGKALDPRSDELWLDSSRTHNDPRPDTGLSRATGRCVWTLGARLTDRVLQPELQVGQHAGGDRL